MRRNLFHFMKNIYLYHYTLTLHFSNEKEIPCNCTLLRLQIYLSQLSLTVKYFSPKYKYFTFTTLYFLLKTLFNFRWIKVILPISKVISVPYPYFLILHSSPSTYYWTSISCFKDIVSAYVEESTKNGCGHQF